MKNEQHRRLSLQFKVAFTTTVALLTLAVALVYSYSRQMAAGADAEEDKRAAAVITGLANECEYALLVGNKSLLQRAVVKALAQADVDSAVVFNEKGRVMAAAGHVDAIAENKAGADLVARYKGTGVQQPSTNASSMGKTYYLPVYLQPASVSDGAAADELSSDSAKEVGQQLGLVELNVSVASMNRVLQRARAAAVLIAAILALVVSVLCVFIVHRMVQPLRGLVAGTKELTAGNLGVRVAAASTDEFGELARAFNDMAGSLQQTNAEILNYQQTLEQRVKDRTIELEKEIAERKQAERALRDSEMRYRTLFDNANDGMILADAETRKFSSGNKKMQQMLGYSVEELANLGIEDIHPTESLPYVMEQFEKQSRQEIELAENLPVKRKDGSILYADINAFPIQIKGKNYLAGVFRDITERKQAQAQMEDMHKQLLDVSREAGMAEVATNVLHNVGNVLNSINVSTALVSDKVRESRVSSLAKVVALMRAHQNDLAAFLTEDPKGMQLCDYLDNLAQYLGKEQTGILKELESLNANIDHIKEIVTMQQSYARAAGIVDTLPIVDLVEDTLRMNNGALARHQVQVIRDYAATPSVPVDKHKVLQILVNLVRNAKYALDDGGGKGKRLTIRVATDHDDSVTISVIDNGVGIPPENLTRVFSYGFTTRKDGHGFGLHSGAIAAKEMGGSLRAHSDGLGRGATFTLSLPLHHEHENL